VGKGMRLEFVERDLVDRFMIRKTANAWTLWKCWSRENAWICAWP